MYSQYNKSKKSQNEIEEFRKALGEERFALYERLEYGQKLIIKEISFSQAITYLEILRLQNEHVQNPLTEHGVRVLNGLYHDLDADNKEELKSFLGINSPIYSLINTNSKIKSPTVTELGFLLTAQRKAAKASMAEQKVRTLLKKLKFD